MFVTQHIHPNADATVGLEADQAKWTAFNEGIDYKAAWSSAHAIRKMILYCLVQVYIRVIHIYIRSIIYNR